MGTKDRDIIWVDNGDVLVNVKIFGCLFFSTTIYKYYDYKCTVYDEILVFGKILYKEISYQPSRC